MALYSDTHIDTKTPYFLFETLIKKMPAHFRLCMLLSKIGKVSNEDLTTMSDQQRSHLGILSYTPLNG